MTEKLTLEMVMKYPKAEIQIIIKEVIYKDSVKELIERGIGEKDVFQPGSKLILRPLSSLTDEEREEIGMIQRKFSLRALADNSDETYRKHFQKITDKYREWNIDIDGLQERGIAVYDE